jgi:hypothetical protein
VAHPGRLCGDRAGGKPGWIAPGWMELVKASRACAPHEIWTPTRGDPGARLDIALDRTFDLIRADIVFVDAHADPLC